VQRGGNNPPVTKVSKPYQSILLTFDFRVAALGRLVKKFLRLGYGKGTNVENCPAPGKDKRKQNYN
jgi:hypothetical protein